MLKLKPEITRNKTIYLVSRHFKHDIIKILNWAYHSHNRSIFFPNQPKYYYRLETT